MFKKGVINIEISDDINQSLAFAQSNGFKFIEIHSAWGKNVEELDVSEAKTLAQMVKDHGLKVSCISSTLFIRCFLDDRPGFAPEIKGFQTVAGDYKMQLDTLQRAFQTADILGTSLIRIFGFKKVENLTEDTFTMAAEKLQEPAKLAQRAGHTLVMENCPHTSFGWGRNAAKLVSMVNSPVLGMLWDPAGAIRSGEPDCLYALKDILPLVRHVHVKDVTFVENKRQYLTLGKGKVPWKTILQALNDNQYEGVLSLEPHYIGDDGTKAGAVIESNNIIDNITAGLELKNEG
jgi:sugar phosphate isomerase/epimerase